MSDALSLGAASHSAITILVCVFPNERSGVNGGQLGTLYTRRHPLLDTGIALNYRDYTMTQLNFKNRTLWTGDNLDIMRGLNSETVDLIYLDPPFNSNRDYSAPIGSAAAGAAFKNTWTLNDVDLAWHGLIAEENPGLYGIIAAAGVAHGKAMKSYLIMMAVRLLEMKRILKPTGSIPHCNQEKGDQHGQRRDTDGRGRASVARAVEAHHPQHTPDTPTHRSRPTKATASGR